MKKTPFIFRQWILLGSTMVLILSCKKDHRFSQHEKLDIYVAGYQLEQNGHFQNVAMLWKNGNVLREIPSAQFNSVAVSKKGDVYVAGMLNGEGTLWKNGEILLQRSGSFNSVIVSKGNVYVTGGEEGSPTVWKNSVAHPLSLLLPGSSNVAGSIAVSKKGDVYVVSQGITEDYAILWKNGIPGLLTDGSQDSTFNAFSIALSNRGDVYVAGQNWTENTLSDVGILWKNEVAHRVSPVQFANCPESVAVSNGNVYVTGYSVNFIPTVWINGAAHQLATNSESGTGDIANAVAVSKGDIYVAGMLGAKATLWINGIAYSLSDKSSEAVSVAVGRKNMYRGY